MLKVLMNGDSGRKIMITINEIWKDVRNFEGEYQVSSLGNFKSLPKKIWNGHGFYILISKVKHNNFREYCENKRTSCLGYGWRKANA